MRSKRGRDSFNKFRGLLLFLTRFFSLFPLRLRIRLLELFRSVKGKKGIALRFVLFKATARACGDNVAIFPDVYLLNPQNIGIGSNVSIHPMCYLEGGKSQDYDHGILIGDDVSIANSCVIIPGNHIFESCTLPIRDQGVRPGLVRIEDDVWLGAKVTLLSGVRVATGCVIAAGAVVTKSTEANGVYSGVPARRIKNRCLLENSPASLASEQ